MSSVKLLKNLNFASKINENNAVTDPGKEVLSKYRGFCYSNAPTCTVVNNFVREASNFTFDSGLTSILESVMKFIGENKISWKLASACESILNNNSHYSYIAKSGVEQVGKLLEMNESEVVSYIKAGALKGVQYIPEFRNICKEIYKTHICEKSTPSYTWQTPVSFIFVEGQKQYFQVLGKTFAFEDGKVNEAVCNDKEFHEINSLLENFRSIDNSLVYEYNSSYNDKCQFVISEENKTHKLEIKKGETVVESFDNKDSFMEYCNNISKVLPVNEKLRWLNSVSMVAKVFENSDEIYGLDCTKVVNTSDGSLFAITEAENNVNLTIFRNYNHGTSTSNYDFVVEALNNVTSLTGIDLKSEYQARITEDCKKQNPEEVEEINEALKESKKAQISERRKQIAMLAEKYKNDPARITLLNSLAQELSLLDA